MISRVRLWRRWSQNEVALKADMRPQTISEIELGKRMPKSVPKIMKLADALEMPREQLFKWIVNEFEYQDARSAKRREQ
ncbi:helix-turn-helix transcriptional regulator [Amycolatopsis sp. WAC 04182]|uniref:helix-turn-helix transcriptional regulator n=1 Tax=Amycolatopsis sp. WAC 04182 TaxID=2203198 RepID=UPI0035142FD0